MKDSIPNIMSSERVRRVFHFIIIKKILPHCVSQVPHVFYETFSWNKGVCDQLTSKPKNSYGVIR